MLRVFRPLRQATKLTTGIVGIEGVYKLVYSESLSSLTLTPPLWCEQFTLIRYLL